MTCPDSGKRCFNSSRQARLASRDLGNKIRTYLCPHCRCFHITQRTTG